MRIVSDNLLRNITIKREESYNHSDVLSEKTFVITGSLNHYKNRDELKNILEANGAKVSSSISSKTSYLINNDINSNSSKNKKAKQLNIPIITEEEVMTMIAK